MVRARGFTLIELVVVILLLGVMATFTSQFISTGTQLYADASAREQLMSDVRFGVERLNREVRDAVPGTLSLSSDGQCVSFWPLAAVSRYVSLPLSASGSLTFLSPMSGVVQAADYAVVYPVGMSPSTPYGCSAGLCVARVSSAPVLVAGETQLWSVGLSAIPSGSFGGFAAESPGKRLFFAREQVSFCRNGLNQLIRESTRLASGVTSRSVMAEHLTQVRFYQDPQSFHHQGELGVNLTFSQRGETVQFSHKVEVNNVP